MLSPFTVHSHISHVVPVSAISNSQNFGAIKSITSITCDKKKERRSEGRAREGEEKIVYVSQISTRCVLIASFRLRHRTFGSIATKVKLIHCVLNTISPAFFRILCKNCSYSQSFGNINFTVHCTENAASLRM